MSAIETITLAERGHASRKKRPRRLSGGRTLGAGGTVRGIASSGGIKALQSPHVTVVQMWRTAVARCPRRAGRRPWQEAPTGVGADRVPRDWPDDSGIQAYMYADHRVSPTVRRRVTRLRQARRLKPAGISHARQGEAGNPTSIRLRRSDDHSRHVIRAEYSCYRSNTWPGSPA